MQTITMYYPEGAAAYTENVAAHEAESHIAGSSLFAKEARALCEFHAADHVPMSLLGGEFTLQTQGTDESGVPFARYQARGTNYLRDRSPTNR